MIWLSSRGTSCGNRTDLLELEQKGDRFRVNLSTRVQSCAQYQRRIRILWYRPYHQAVACHGKYHGENTRQDLSITPDVTEALLKGVDKLRLMLDDVGNAEEVSIDAEINVLNPFLDAAMFKAKAQDKSQTLGIDSAIRQKASEFNRKSYA